MNKLQTRVAEMIDLIRKYCDKHNARGVPIITIRFLKVGMARVESSTKLLIGDNTLTESHEPHYAVGKHGLYWERLGLFLFELAEVG